MKSRRDVMLGAACLAGAGVAYGLVPRRRVTLLHGARLDDIVPRTVGEWSSRDVSDLVAPQIEGSLMSRLYGETVGRIYQQGSTGGEIMMLLAHGDTQSDDLQLHRPEVCYPAFGYALSDNAPTLVALPGGGALPCRRLVAQAPDRREAILYWSRLGEFLPLTHKQQQLDRLRTAMKGLIADGLLARFSVATADAPSAIALMQAFIPLLVRGVAPDKRAALVGTRLARSMAQAGV